MLSSDKRGTNLEIKLVDLKFLYLGLPNFVSKLAFLKRVWPTLQAENHVGYINIYVKILISTSILSYISRPSILRPVLFLQQSNFGLSLSLS
jgi:hypothetical protein